MYDKYVGKNIILMMLYVYHAQYVSVSRNTQMTKYLPKCAVHNQSTRVGPDVPLSKVLDLIFQFWWMKQSDIENYLKNKNKIKCSKTIILWDITI